MKRDEWVVELVALPLPGAPVNEARSVAKEVFSPKTFDNEIAALNFARSYVEQGYRLRIVGPHGQILEHAQIVERIQTC